MQGNHCFNKIKQPLVATHFFFLNLTDFSFPLPSSPVSDPEPKGQITPNFPFPATR